MGPDTPARQVADAVEDHVMRIARMLPEPDVSDSAAREEDPYLAGYKERAARRLHAIGCECLERPYCAPHLGIGISPYCADHVDASWTHKATPPAETYDEPESLTSAILDAWQRGWRPGETSEEKVPPVEPDDLERDRAEQLIVAVATAIRAYFPDGITVVRQSGTWAESIARGLLAHPYVRDALEPARAVVWAEPLGTIVSFSYPDSEVPTKATHARVRLEPGVVVGSDTIGRKVAVAK